MTSYWHVVPKLMICRNVRIKKGEEWNSLAKKLRIFHKKFLRKKL